MSDEDPGNPDLMNDTEPDADDEQRTENAASGAAVDGDGQLDDVEVWRYLRLGAIGLLALLALIATVQLYTNASAAIARWVSPDYVPVFQVAFNLVVLLIALSGLAAIARRRFTADGE